MFVWERVKAKEVHVKLISAREGDACRLALRGQEGSTESEDYRVWMELLGRLK